MSDLPFTCALITGGGGGIGKAIAAYLIRAGKKVLIAGRTESKLQSTAAEIGAAGYYVLDTGSTASIPTFIKTVTRDHPDLDCLVNNAGVQRPLKILSMDPSDFLGKADQEIDINIRGPMHLTLGLLPHFRGKDRAMVINISSVLGFVPFSVINPVYNGTKAWVHFWSMNLRSQIAAAGLGDRIKVIEIAPPTVATDLHRERDDPDDNKKDKNPDALSVDEFMDEVSKKLEKGDEMIGAGMSADLVDKWYGQFGDFYDTKTGGKK